MYKKLCGKRFRYIPITFTCVYWSKLYSFACLRKYAKWNNLHLFLSYLQHRIRILAKLLLKQLSTQITNSLNASTDWVPFNLLLLRCCTICTASYERGQKLKNRISLKVQFRLVKGCGLTKRSLITFYNSNVLDVRCGYIILTFIVFSEWLVFVRSFDFTLV